MKARRRTQPVRTDLAPRVRQGGGNPEWHAARDRRIQSNAQRVRRDEPRAIDVHWGAWWDTPIRV